MTELEAKQYISELQLLNKTYEKLGNCRIDLSIEEVYRGQKLAWVKIKELSIKIS